MRGWSPSRFIGLLATVAATFLVLPLVALAVGAPWSRFGRVLQDPTAAAALRLSLVSSFSSLALCLLLGVPLAWALARWEFRGRSLLRAVTVLPMVLPPVVAGVALLLAFGPAGMVASGLASSTTAAVLAPTFVSLPFLVVTVEAGLRQLDERYEQAAATLGASRWTVLRRVTIPAIAPSLAAGAALSWARALGEFGATVTFAGDVPGDTQTLPLLVYRALEQDRELAMLLAVALMTVSVTVLVTLRGRFLR